jgi:hypothetical protein
MLSAERFLRSGLKGSSGALAGGGADTDNARRSGPVTVTSLGDRRTRRERDGPVLLVWRGTGAVTPGDRLRPVPGKPCAAAAADVGLASEGRGEAAAPQRRDPRRPGPPIPVIPAARYPSVARACARSLVLAVRRARRRCALEKRAIAVAGDGSDRCGCPPSDSDHDSAVIRADIARISRCQQLGSLPPGARHKSWVCSATDDQAVPLTIMAVSVGCVPYRSGSLRYSFHDQLRHSD